MENHLIYQAHPADKDNNKPLNNEADIHNPRNFNTLSTKIAKKIKIDTGTFNYKRVKQYPCVISDINNNLDSMLSDL